MRGDESGMTTATPMRPPTGDHVPALDGIRGLALLLVILFHARLGVPRSTFDDLTLRLFGVGWCGVDLFFVLSGFLITGILLDARGSAGYLRNFYARRILRIFPLYFAFLAVAFLLLPDRFEVSQYSWDYLAYYLLYLTNILHAVEPRALSFPLAVTWSLSVEEQFYIVWPFVVLFAGPRRLMQICLVLIPLALAIRIGMQLNGVSRGIIYSMTFCKLDALAVGGLIAAIVRLHRTQVLQRTFTWVGRVSLTGIVILFVVTKGYLSQYDPYVQSIGFTCLSLFFGSVLFHAYQCKPDSITYRFWCSMPLRVMGKYSYAMYLCHVPVQLWVADHLWSRTQMDWIPGPTVLPGQIIFWALVFAISLLIAVVSWHILEKHFLKLKKYFVYREMDKSADHPAPVVASGSVVETATQQNQLQRG